MRKNDVVDSTRFLIRNPEFVKINQSRLEQIAEEWAGEKFETEKLDLPIFPEERDERTIDFFFVINAIGFAFTDFETKQKFKSQDNGQEYLGYYGMVACMKRALDEGIPVLDG
ncbi:queuosine salvage family protein, partial [Candidatus Woesearchaeota archaeon]|nr:queuosine salvage family protein [Candidatus Woesearchaeota archaeon]